MSYTALYRKWRPKNFDEVKGQDAVVTTLKNQIKMERIGHAYLFCGTRGTGKTSIAKIMARAVNCEQPGEGNPCNTCATCRSIMKESSVNVVEMDAASNNGVDDIRQIKEQVLYPPSFGKYRVFIIDEVHMLSNQAFNALLKTLEEPPSYVIFILATTEAHKIPVTVLSRCQRYDFKRISVDTIAGRLRDLCAGEGIDIEERALLHIAKNADGALRDALSLLDECVAFHPQEHISYEDVLDVLGSSDNEEFANLFHAVHLQDTLKVLEHIERLVLSGRDLAQFIGDFLWYLRNLLLLKSGDEAYKMIDASRESIDKMAETAAATSGESLMRFIRVLSELHNNLRYSSQKRVLLELAMIQLLTPAMEESKEAILDRLARLEKAVQQGALRLSVQDTESEAKLSLPRKEALTGKREISLEKATYEDLMRLKKDWAKITSSLGGGSAALFKDTGIEAFDDTAMTIIFLSSSMYNLASKEEKIQELRDLVEREYQKSFVFRTELKEREDKQVITYVSKEYLMDKIKFDIDIED